MSPRGRSQAESKGRTSPDKPCSTSKLPLGWSLVGGSAITESEPECPSAEWRVTVDGATGCLIQDLRFHPPGSLGLGLGR
jgi:hypothetical protein